VQRVQQTTQQLQRGSKSTLRNKIIATESIFMEVSHNFQRSFTPYLLLKNLYNEGDLCVVGRNH